MSTVVGKEDDDNVVVAPTTTISSNIIEKPNVDKREYRHFQIANEMDVLLISDKETDKSSAACDIFVGQLCDLQQYDGIAHFCEHMLFIGTTKYPTENAYDKYLSENGGCSNAFTDLQHTCYFFDVNATKLDGALDRFAQCFVSPLFTQSAIEREILAVDSEHSKNLQQDMWRIYQLSKSQICFDESDSKYSKFGSGNKQSLPILSIREKLLEFYQEYYRKSLKLYKLVVLGSESLDELQTMVIKYFDVPEFIDDFQDLNSKSESESESNHHHRNQLIQELYPPYNNNKWKVPQYLKVIPISEIHAIELQFPMDSQWSNYKIKPTHYLSHLIGHEGSGSLLSLLKSRHLALELYADDNSKSTTSFLIFTIRIELTQLGYEKINEDVIPIIFAYIDLLNEVGPQQWIQNELMTVADLSFKFLSKRDPMDYTCSIAGGMQQYITSEHYISGPYRIYDWDPTLVENCCKCLTPDNVFIMISSPLLQQQQQESSTTSTSTSTSSTFVEEPWYGTQYSKVIIPDEIWDVWRNIKHTNYPELKLPQINDMVATDFDLVDEIKITITDDDDDDSSSSSSNNNNNNNKYPTDEPICIWDTTTTTTTTTTNNTGEKQSNNNIGDTEDGDGGFIIIPKIRLWYKPDNVFKMPKVNLLYNIASAVGMTTPETCVAMELYAELVQESINEFTYLASMAGLHCSISYNAHTGFSIQISGYNHKAHVLLEKIIDTMINLDIAPSDDGDGGGGGSNENGIFERIVYKLEQQYKSFLVAQPYNHAVYGSTLCLEEDAMTIESKLRALQNLNYDEVSFLSKRYWKHCCVEGLVHGNASAQHAKDISKQILNRLSIRTTTTTSATPGHSLDEDGNNEGNNDNNKNDTEACPPPPSSLLLSSRRVVMFEPGTSCLYRFREFNDSNTNSCLHYLLQMGPLELEDNATLAFLQHLIREPAFNKLRTDEQLGYIVHSSVKTSGDNIKGLLLMIQSDSYDPIYLESRVENFLLDFRTRIVQMTSEDIQTNVDAVVAGFLEKNRNLGEESYRYWHVISNHSYDFRRLQKLADLVKDGMTKERVLMFYDRFVAPNSILGRKVSVQVFCNAHRDKMDEEPTSSTSNNIHIVRDPAEFRRSMPFHPLPKKVNVKVVDVPV